MARDRKLVWPTGLRETSARSEWFKRISSLPPGLDLMTASKKLGEPYGAVRRWALAFGYSFPDLRRVVENGRWDAVDWSRRDAEIARELSVTRECVRLVRKARGIGPSAWQSMTARIEKYIEQHRDELHGLPVEEVMRRSGENPPYHAVRRMLRRFRVRPYEPRSNFRNVEWRLPNRELARIWGTGPRYISNVRARLRVGPAKWNGNSAHLAADPLFQELIEIEKRKAAEAKHHRKLSGTAHSRLGKSKGSGTRALIAAAR